MTCKDLEQQFDAYLYGELSSSERDSLELHLKECTACQSELEQLRRLHALIKERSSPEVPAEWLVRCRQRLEEVIEREEHGWRRLLADWFSVAPGSFSSRLAAMLTLILFGFGLLDVAFGRKQSSPSPIQPTDTAACVVSGRRPGAYQQHQPGVAGPGIEQGSDHVECRASRHAGRLTR